MSTELSHTSYPKAAGRLRVPRSRGAVGGVLVLILGAWAALVPFIGPSFDLAYTPAPDRTWYWTAARGWLEVLPGGVAVVGGLLLLLSGNRLVTSLGGWLAAVSGAWLVVGPALAAAVRLHLGVADPSRSTGNQAATQLLFFYGVGAAILVIAGLALGRLSVLTVRDVLAAEQRVAEPAAPATGRHEAVPATATTDQLTEQPAVTDRPTTALPAAEPVRTEPVRTEPEATDSEYHDEERAGHRWRQLIHHR